MTKRLLCGDRDLRVAWRAVGGALEVTVDERAFRPRVVPVGPGSWALEDGEGRVVGFHCVRDGREIHLFWQGQVYRLLEADGARVAHRHDASGLEAPMPGRVIKIGVEPGQAVERGDELIVVEAMKLENALRAPRAGRVRTVGARVGDMVGPGVVLVELE